MEVFDSGSHYVSEGDPFDSCEEEDGDCETQLALDSTVHAVRCCADVNPGGWEKESECTNWHESLDCEELSWGAAKLFCESEGGRLCSLDEVEAGCVMGDGCSYDGQLVIAQFALF